jgi:hypothetical protein
MSIDSNTTRKRGQYPPRGRVRLLICAGLHQRPSLARRVSMAESTTPAAYSPFVTDLMHSMIPTEKRDRPLDFPVLMRDDRVVSCLDASATLKNVPIVAVDYVFIAPQLREKAEAWLRAQRDTIIVPKPENSP